MSGQGDLEVHALQVIMDKGSTGILQSDLWKELSASSREGSRISIKLEGKKLVRRERELNNGRWTYRVFIKRHPVNIDPIMDVPCVSCEELTKCEAESEVSPVTCRQMDKWLGLT